MENENQQKISIDLLPTQDRNCAIILVRSDGTIRLKVLADTITQFAKTLEDRAAIQESRIRTPQRKLIVP